MSGVLCVPCQALFTGELLKQEGFKDETDFYQKSDQHDISLLSPPDLCRLCDLIRQQLERNHSKVQELLKQFGSRPPMVRRTLTFEIRNGQHSHIVLEGTMTHSWGHFYYFPGSWNDKFHPAEVSSSTDSQGTFAWARMLLQDCIDSHEDCVMDKLNLELPSRLLQFDNLSQRIRLVDSSSLASVPIYTTLSHRWGNAKFLLLTEITSETLYAGIDISVLPKTFRDAIRIAKELGSDFIWIDSLCIQQDSKDDWYKESKLMADIYKGSLCNIGAAASRGNVEGCFRTRNLNAMHPCVVAASFNIPSISGHYYFYDWYFTRKWHNDEMNKLPLFSRGWVFQERVLSLRMLSFAEHVFWDCKTTQISEKHQRGYTKSSSTYETITVHTPMSNRDTDSRYIWWDEAVISYSLLDLTFTSDKLVAISGVGRNLHGSHQYKYIAGMWQYNFPHAFLFTCLPDDAGISPTVRTKEQARPLPYRAPSWSWASLTTPSSITYLEGRGSYNQRLSTITHVKLSHATTDIYGSVLSGSMVLQGQLLKCISAFDISSYIPWPYDKGSNRHDPNLPTISLESLDGMYQIDFTAILYFDFSVCKWEVQSLYFLPLITDSFPSIMLGLILLPVAGRCGTYERCGIFGLYPNRDVWDWPVEFKKDPYWAGIGERVDARDTKRESENLEVFEVKYSVGVTEEVAEQESRTEDEQLRGKAEEHSSEYLEFDGMDYTIRII